MRIISLLVFLGTFFSLKTYSSERDNSQDLAEENMNKCILETIEDASGKNYWVYAKDISRYCACIGNIEAQGLNVEACKGPTPIRHNDVKEVFDVNF